MAMSAPTSSITLYGGYGSQDEVPAGSSTAIMLRLNENQLQELKKAVQSKDRAALVTGDSPKLRIGNRTISLNITKDAFRNELFASMEAASPSNLTFKGFVSHRAEVKYWESKTSQDTSGTDAALAALQSNLASYEKEKQANQVNITNSLLNIPKNRFDAARKEKQEKRRPGLNSFLGGSPSLSATTTPKLGPGPTSAPANEVELRTKAMRVPVIHLLAMKPASTGEVSEKTHIPRHDLTSILSKVGKASGDSTWSLADRAYKDLDVYNFKYQSQEDRQAAIDNAVRAYDRLRLGKDDKLWQLLLPKKDRDKGIVLSRLHLGAGQPSKGLTPHYQPSPNPHADGAGDSRVASAANTPRLGASTPRPTSSKGDVMKRLLAKDPKKARAAEEAKEKKRKEREAAASDREGGKPAKRQATKKNTNPNIKSAEFVHSSDEESGDDEVPNQQPKASPDVAKTTTAKSKTKTAANTSSDSSDVPLKASTMPQKSTTSKAKQNAAPVKTSSPAVKAAKSAPVGKRTPQTTNGGLSAPNSQQKSQRSPQKTDSKPSVPSPLGAARPRVASDVSDRGAVGVQRVRQGAETPKGLGITSDARKRTDTITSASSPAMNGAEKKGAEKPRNPTVNGMGTHKAALANGTSPKQDAGLKRKTEDSPSQQNEAGGSAPKHRKTESASQHPQKRPATHDAGAPNGDKKTSPDGGNVSSDSVNSVLDTITYVQGVNLAEDFRDKYYPAYAKLYDEQAAMEKRGEQVSKVERDRLLQMHKRLEQMKKEIWAASEREHVEEER